MKSLLIVRRGKR